MLAAMTTGKNTILVLGLGNVLLTDEAAGVRLAEHVGALPDAAELGLEAMDGGTMGLTLMVAMEDANAMIVCDSAWLGEQPGAFKLFEGAEMDHFLRTRGRNPHDIGLDDVMDGLRLRGAVPEKRALVGIQPEILTVGEHMTPAVAAAIPRAAEAVLALARRWRG
ncbi:hydrogenase 2 maturation protease [Sinisalibacter lacisalsi]|uniref:Hydrogenase 2 maturation protease n=2 Tax=Sinisalibacter lacisalsi TaxID=1526570 RepID=A0ABQ1QSY6_9RHOB|nr:hydrogenase 2 maturation protease [Sinisalibacter lacisalsi]